MKLRPGPVLASLVLLSASLPAQAGGEPVPPCYRGFFFPSWEFTPGWWKPAYPHRELPPPPPMPRAGEPSEKPVRKPATPHVLTRYSESDADDFFQKALTKFRSGDYEGALVDLNAVVGLRKFDIRGWYLKALVERRLGEFEDAAQSRQRYREYVAMLKLPLEETERLLGKFQVYL